MLSYLKGIFETLSHLGSYVFAAIKSSIAGLNLALDSLATPATYQAFLPALIAASTLIVTAVCAIKFIFGRL